MKDHAAAACRRCTERIVPADRQRPEHARSRKSRRHPAAIRSPAVSNQRSKRRALPKRSRDLSSRNRRRKLRVRAAATIPSIAVRKPAPAQRSLRRSASPADRTSSPKCSKPSKAKAHQFCSEEFAKVQASTLNDVSLNIDVTGTQGEDYPFRMPDRRRHDVQRPLLGSDHLHVEGLLPLPQAALLRRRGARALRPLVGPVLRSARRRCPLLLHDPGLALLHGRHIRRPSACTPWATTGRATAPRT